MSRGISQQILAERIAKDKACLTNLMNNLEKKGYVHRKEDLADRRNKLVFLTPEGKNLRTDSSDSIRFMYMQKNVGIESIETMLSELKRYVMYLKMYKKYGAVLSSLFLAVLNP